MIVIVTCKRRKWYHNIVSGWNERRIKCATRHSKYGHKLVTSHYEFDKLILDAEKLVKKMWTKKNRHVFSLFGKLIGFKHIFDSRMRLDSIRIHNRFELSTKALFRTLDFLVWNTSVGAKTKKIIGSDRFVALTTKQLTNTDTVNEKEIDSGDNDSITINEKSADTRINIIGDEFASTHHKVGTQIY